MNKKNAGVLFSILLLLEVFCNLSASAHENDYTRATHHRPLAAGRRCGDGVCDAKEKANPNLCPNDCRQTQSKATQSTTDQSLPISAEESSLSFITGFKLDNFENVREISRIHFELAKELKLDYILVPVTLPREADGRKTDWSAGADYYYLFELSRQYGVKILPAFYKLGGNDRDYNKFANFVISFLEEFYKGGNIDYIEFQNEPAKGYDGKVSARFKGTPADLAKSHLAAYNKVKEKYPLIKVGTAGFMAVAVTPDENQMMNDYYKEYFSTKPNFDFFSLHQYPKTSGYLQTTKDTSASPYNFLSEAEIFNVYRRLLNNYGYGDKPIFVSEGNVDMPYRNSDGTLIFHWLRDNEASMLLIERFVLGLSNRERNNIMGLMTSGSQNPTTGFFALQSVRKNKNEKTHDQTTSGYTQTNHFEFYNQLLEFLRKYPYYSRRITGEINSTNYWVEEFKDKDGKRMWLAFCPLLFKAVGETSGGRVRAVATEKLMVCPQQVILSVDEAQSVKISSLFGTRTIRVINGSISFGIEEEPVFIEEN